MRKVLVVAAREYQSAVKTKAFIFSLVAMPVLMSAGMVITHFLKDRVDITDKTIVVLDRSGAIFDRLKAAAEAYNERGTRDPESGKQVRPRYIFDRAEAPAGEPPPRQLAEQGQRVRSGEVYAFAVIGPGVKEVGGTNGGVRIYSDAPVFDEFKDWLDYQVNEAVREDRFAAAGLPKDQVDRALSPVTFESYKPMGIDAETGEVTGGKKKSDGADVGVPVIMMFMMFMVITVGATPLISSVLEEKMQRIAEVLLGSVTPFELMAGKLIGVVGISLTILCFYLLGGAVGAKISGKGQLIPANLGVLLFWFLSYAALAVLMFGSMFIAVGAACSDMKEAQNMLMPVWMLVMIPLFVWFNVVREPASTFSVAVSLFPPATPMLMVLRTAAMPSIPLWQPLLGMVLVIGTTLLCVFAAGRIFRVGILMQGKGAKVRDLIRWAIKG